MMKNTNNKTAIRSLVYNSYIRPTFHVYNHIRMFFKTDMIF